MPILRTRRLPFQNLFSYQQLSSLSGLWISHCHRSCRETPRRTLGRFAPAGRCSQPERGARRHAHQAAYLPTILEVAPGKELHGEGPGGIDVDAFKPH